ncbi:MAG: hypothetical protein KGI03_04290 [Patescibacteria group bacterium]|nr:hypothetical protein [Patescibacteria group bacterium]
MDERIRAAIIMALKSSPTRSVDSLVPELAKGLGVRQEEVHRTIQLMEDAGTVSYAGTSRTALRLHLKGYEATAPARERTWRYLQANWVALAALAISLIALFR